VIDQKRAEDALKNIVALMSIIQISQKVVNAVASDPGCTEQMLQSALADIASALPSSVAKPPAYQPIASAPKDGTSMLVWLNDGWVAMRWCEEVGGAWQCSNSGHILSRMSKRPEWWMPTPEPPKDTA